MIDFAARPGKRDALAVFYPNENEDFVKSAPAGAFRWTGLYSVADPGPFGMNFKCPCGCGAVHGVGFDNRPPGYPGSTWKWNGDKEKPTLQPSLGLHKSRDDQAVGQDGYHWHGFLTDGVFLEC